MDTTYRELLKYINEVNVKSSALNFNPIHAKL